MGHVLEVLVRLLNERRLIMAGIVLLIGTVVASAIAVWIARQGPTAYLWMGIACTTAIMGVAAFLVAPRVEAIKLVDQARRMVEHKRYDMALSRLNRALDLQPGMVEAYITRSDAYRELQQIDLAMEDAEQAVRIAPQYPETRLVRARAYSYRGLHNAAIRDVEMGLREQPNWDAGYLELARLHLILEDYDAALVALRNLDNRTASDHTRYDAIVLAGQVYEKNLHDLDQAIMMYTRAIPILPDCKIGYMHRAYTYFNRGDMYQAAEDLLRAAQRPATPEDLDQYHWLRAVCYNRRWKITGEDGDLTACVSALQRSVLEDAPVYQQNSREWLAALTRQQVKDSDPFPLHRPPAPTIYPN
jgi:tetratricopeptide (TPR) repeat protein